MEDPETAPSRTRTVTSSGSSGRPTATSDRQRWVGSSSLICVRTTRCWPSELSSMSNGRRATVGRDIGTRVALGPGPDLLPGGGVAGLMRPVQLDGVELSHLDCLLSGVFLGR